MSCLLTWYEASSRFQVLADDVRQMPGTAAERLAHLIHGHLQILTEDPHQARTFLNEIRFLPDSERKRSRRNVRPVPADFSGGHTQGSQWRISVGD